MVSLFNKINACKIAKFIYVCINITEIYSYSNWLLYTCINVYPNYGNNWFTWKCNYTVLYILCVNAMLHKF